ncbi:hypothetical protein LTR37_000898 [Vermiconidia calcicola]|uniref:Uncharacterized protein n=1 Tax=Vermiconidia calcicola TaxID=1690605 RepID=A0ACC3NY77_9PEZI|nr:hypothetical protein LTR37_000898 [Vermiconidia calcicola]
MFSKFLLLGAFASYVVAQSQVLFFTNVPNPVTDGEPQAILWSSNDTQSPVTILLRKGISTNLKTVSTLTNDATGGTFIWTPPASLPNGIDYALQIKQGSETNYYGPFSVQGAIPASVSQASASPTLIPTTSAHSNATMNSTMTMTGTGISMGTATTIHRNTTMSSPTLSPTKSRKPTTNMASSNDASSQTSSAGGAGGASAIPTGGASALAFTTGSSLILALGAVAAMLYLQ